MRILFVTDFYHPYSGGVEIHVRTVATELAARGHTVAVATLPTPADVAPRTIDGDVQVFTVRHSAEMVGARFNHRDRAWAPPFPDPVTVRELRSVVRTFRPDVIHGHDWLARSVLPRVVSGSIPIVTSLHYYTRSCAKKTLWRNEQICSGPALGTCLSCAADHYGRARGTVVTLGLRLGSAIEDRRTDRYISVSAATENGNGLSGDPKSTVVANPLPSAVAAAGDSGDDSALLPDGLPDGPFILFVGDIRPEKGVAVLADAMGLLRSRPGRSVPLVVVGQRMSDRIALPEDTVELGHVDNEVVQALWRRATVGAIPSLWPEPFGLVAVEALAAGCPVVASRVGGLVEILEPVGADLVEPGNPEALADALAGLLDDPRRRADLRSAAISSADRFSIAAVVDRIEAEYRRVIDGADRTKR